MKQKIAIVGAGVSGLVTALYLENLGYSPIIYEASNSVGGRVKSDVVDGYILDHGFQVLLSEYPIAKKYLDYKSLELIPFENGSFIFKEGKKYTIGDPLRNKSFLISNLTASVGSFSDKLKIFKLSKQLKKKTIDAIFSTEEITTIDYLKNYGFTNAILNDFFIPFFGGIFLEEELKTSSRMFEFIFKMFSEGSAVIPKKGMQAIPDQLASKLKTTEIIFSKKVNQIQGNKILFEDETIENVDFVIVATEASKLISNMSSTGMEWKATETLYFEIPKSIYEKNMIGLVCNTSNSLINSICFPKTKKGDTKKELLSISVIKKHDLSEEQLIKSIKKELIDIFQLKEVAFLKSYNIPCALPNLTNIQYALSPSETQLTDSIFLAGDTMLNGSLNAAMLSGELAAQAVHEKITGTVLG